MTESAPAVIEAKELCVSVGSGDARQSILAEFDLRLQAGEIAGLVGQPGSGKSTAALALLGLARKGATIEAGQVLFEGRDLLQLGGDALQKVRGADIGLITQNPRGALHPLLNVGAQLANVCRSHGRMSRAQATAKAAELLARVGINDPQQRLSAFPHELSTGMAQRVVIAMALAAEPKLIVADEPTSGLDVTIQAQLLDNLWDGAQEQGGTVLLITQDLGIVANYCDRVFVLHDGKIVEQQSVAGFFQAPEHPYSREILSLQKEAQVDAGGERPVPSAPSSALVSVSNLRKTFTLKSGAIVQAADDVDFQLPRGETLGLVGESGSGKTTVGRTLLRLEKPTGGEIDFDGIPVHELNPQALRVLRSRMQIVFQDPLDSMDPRWTVAEIIGEPLSSQKIPREERNERVAAMLAAVNLPATMGEAKPQTLSAGQQQRVAIARAMATQPDFVVLDEPTSALTPETTREVLELLRQIQTDTGVSYLFISHDLNTVRFLSHRVAVMYLGQIVEIGSRDQVLEDPQHPYSKALLAAYLRPDPAQRRVDREQRETLQGEVPSPIDLPQGCYLYGRCPRQVGRCRDEAQDLIQLEDNRLVRCWRATAERGS